MDKHDLVVLENLLLSAKKVVAMEDVYDGQRDVDVIGLRHDVDHDLETAVKIAEWEANRGFRATYFILHDAPEYWYDKSNLIVSLNEIAELGHEIGIHNNAIATSLMYLGQPDTPAEILYEAIVELRNYGYRIRGTVAHGDPLCYREGEVYFVNDEMFEECVRENLSNIGTTRRPLSYFGLEYDANWLPRSDYLSDSGGKWNQWPVTKMPGQLHILWHPCWWKEAFSS